MKKIIIALGLVLGLSGVSALQAQMRIYNENLVKFGNVNTNPTLSSGFEVNMQDFLFKGNKAQFNLNGDILTLSSNLGVRPGFAPANPTAGGIVINPNFSPATIFITGPKDKVAIGSTTQPLYSVYATKMYSDNYNALSDRRYKTNIQNLSPALNKVMRLRPVKFDYLDEKDNPNSLDSTRMNRVGLIAQELVEVVPEAVQWLWPDDIYMVDYTTLIPFLIKSMQEQQAQIEALRSELQTLKTAR